MLQEIEMTKEEQMTMYMKCSKKELCEMLIEANRHLKNLPIHDVGRSVSVEIEDRDIATIEALHDLLLDAHGYSLDFITLKRARELTAKMYKAFD